MHQAHRRIRVLLVEDNVRDGELLLRALRQYGYDPEWRRVETEADLSAALEEHHDVIFSDYYMPRLSGLRALALAQAKCPDVPCIIVSGTIGEETAVKTMQHGAVDYLLKDNLVRLGPAVERALEIGKLRREHRQKQKALRRSEENLARAQQVAHIGSWELDLANLKNVNANPLYWSDELFRIFGHEPGGIEVTNDNFFAAVHPDDREPIRQAVAETLRTGRPYSIDHRVIRPDGTERIVHEQADLICDPVTGRPVKLIGTTQDVTEQKAAEMAWRQSEERFRQVMEAINEVFWMTDLDKQRMLYISPAYERIWGRPADELYRAGTAWLESIHPEDRERVREAAETRQASGTYEETYRIVRPDGSVRWIYDRAFPVRDASGRVYRVAGVAEDVTERKKLEEQVLHSQRMEAIGTLAGGIAHDLNNILAPVLMMMGILKLKLTDATDRQLIDLVESSVQRGAGIINQLLLFSRHVTGENAPLDLRHLLREMAALMREIFPRNINIVESRTGDLPPVLGDATQLHQVLMNLCVNARDAMPEGGTLTLTARDITLDDTQAFPHPDARPGRYVVIGVQDTGQGIPKDIRSRIFDPFFTTKEPGKGTGLGLSTVSGIVRNHGGFLTVYSEEGLGTHFKVYLPAAEPSAKPEEPSAVATPARGHGETILLVDDESSILAAEKYVLEQNGYQILTAAGGKEAVHCFLNNQDRIRLVVTDLMMPGMDGMALVRSLRAINQKLPIIATTGLDREEKRDTLAALGITDVLTKPCLPSVLLAAVQRNLDHGP
jgi:PAS domain S-box-containing protein